MPDGSSWSIPLLCDASLNIDRAGWIGAAEVHAAHNIRTKQCHPSPGRLTGFPMTGTSQNISLRKGDCGWCFFKPESIQVNTTRRNACAWHLQWCSVGKMVDYIPNHARNVRCWYVSASNNLIKSFFAFLIYIYIYVYIYIVLRPILPAFLLVEVSMLAHSYNAFRLGMALDSLRKFGFTHEVFVASL